MFSCKYWEISKKPILKNICVRLLLKRLQEVIDQDFLSGESLSKTSRLSNITKIPFAFKPEPSLNLTPTLYFELRFPIFIINGYDRKANACSPWTSCSLKKTALSLVSDYLELYQYRITFLFLLALMHFQNGIIGPQTNNFFVLIKLYF